LTRMTLLSGKPGVGKSTAVLAVAKGIPAKAKTGFTSSEIRVDGRRQGFQTVLLSGESGVLAAPDIESDVRFGSLNERGLPRLGVSFEFLEKVAVPTLHVDLDWRGTVILDEIGPMQAASASFRNAVDRLVKSDVRVFGSIALSDDPWISGLAADDRIAVVMLSKANRDVLTSALSLEFGRHTFV
jgi:nucleoside-triphosphatase